ncbi:eukaryotic peptide chain release factor GTP-binding subunit-like [Arachis duranensis]|uniref:Eukaryotic peptide chain release factor GTP-binding subunit-like n=1 Tax=Arachis duranensis TaxID=130453 RepID=A0A6P4DL06_ARADU|nr:eukaryotic peptide chain release factor GTP-binding subunit-like [Arachis duranensis]
MRRRVNRPRTVNEVSTSSETTALTQSLSEMTSILRQLQLNQQQPQQPQSYQQQPPPPQQHNQQLVPQKVCGICSCYSHYTDECPSLQEDNTLAAIHNFYDRPNQGYYQGGNSNQGHPYQGGNYNQGGGYHNQNWRDNHQQGNRYNNNNGGGQRWSNNSENFSQNRPYNSQNQPYNPQNPQRNYQTYQPPHQRPPPNQSQAPQLTYTTTPSNQDETLRTIIQGQKELQNTLASGLTGLTSTLQALLARMDTLSNSTPEPPIQSVIPSQPQPNPKGGINAITLRSRTQLKEKEAKNSNPIATTQEERIDMEEVEEEETPQVIVEDEAQPTRETTKAKRTLEEKEIAQPLPFPTLAKKARKRIELDPKMVEMFKKVEVTIPLFDAVHQVPRYAKFLKDLCINKDKILELETIPLGSSISALMGALPEKCDDPGPCMVTCTVN